VSAVYILTDTIYSIHVLVLMSKRKLQKYLEKSLPPIVGNKQLTPAILTASKAKYLIEHCSSEIESQIRWRYKSGQSTEKGYNWLQRNIEKEIGHLDNIHIYIWLGTCDLTDYDGTFVRLSTDENSVHSLLDKYQKCIHDTQY